MAASKQTLPRGDPSVRDLEIGIQNKFRWSWLEESVNVDGLDVHLHECYEKLVTAGKVVCTYCYDTINYASSGKKALVRHVKLAKHVNAWRLRRQNMKIVVDSGIVTATTHKENTTTATAKIPHCDRLANSQAMVLGVLAEHSMPMTMAPVVIGLAKELARDTKVLSSLSMDRTSAGYKMYGLEKSFRDKTLAHIRTAPFCLNIDESTSSNNKRVLAVLVSYYSADEGRVLIEHLAALELIRVNTDSIMKALDDLFKEHKIPWTNLMAILMDSCSVMRGSKNGLEVKIRRDKNPELLDIDGDVCHHVHNSCKKFCDPFEYYIEGLFNDTFNDHRWSVDLRELLQEVCQLLGVCFTTPERFISHRWLSCYDCSMSTLRLWDAYQVFYYGFMTKEDMALYFSNMTAIFRQHDVGKNAVERVKQIWKEVGSKRMTDDGKKRKKRIISKVLFQAKKSLLTLGFYQAVLPLLKSYVVLFQSKEPMVHILADRQEQLFREFLSCYVKQEEVIGKTSCQLKLLDLTEDSGQFLRANDMFVGSKAKDILKTMRITDPLVLDFNNRASSAFRACGKYLQIKLPLDNALLRALSSIDPAAHGHHMTCKLLKELLPLLPTSILSATERDSYDLQVHRYMVDQHLPQMSADLQIDEWWTFIQKSGSYPSLCKVVLTVCCIFSGPQVESSFNTMGDVMGAKSCRMKIETYGAIQGVKYALRARKTTALALFKKTTKVEPVDRTMCSNIRNASAVYRRKLQLKREEKERRNKLMKIKKAIETKKSIKLAMDNKAKLARLRHLQQQKKKARTRVLQELAKKLNDKKKSATSTGNSRLL